MTALPPLNTIRSFTVLVAALAYGSPAEVREAESDQPYLGLDSPAVAEGDDGTTTLTFTARLTDANGDPQAGADTITASYRVGTERGNTATAGVDYEAIIGTLVFAPGETSKTVDVDVYGDTEDEDDETLTMRWTRWQNVQMTSRTATGTIEDDDGPRVTIADAEADEGDSIVFTVTLDQEVSGGFAVMPAFTDGTATGGGRDYTENEAALGFLGTAGETKSFKVATTQDGNVEEDETFTVGLTVVTAVPVDAGSTATGTIRDDDTPYLTLDPASVVEGDEGTATMTFTARLTDADGEPKASTETITAQYRVATEAGNTAAPRRDYNPKDGRLTFAPGETSKTVDVDVRGDTEYEDDETLTMRWTLWENVHLTSRAATGTIEDDDGPALTIADAGAGEGMPIVFTVTLDKEVSGGFTVTPVFTDGTATGGGTDYTGIARPLTFAGTAGETKGFRVATTPDGEMEEDETFLVGLTVSGTSVDVDATSTATGTIEDDDGPALTIADSDAEERIPIVFTVTLDKEVAGGFTVTPVFTDGTATGGGRDYTGVARPLTFAGTAGETKGFRVATTHDGDVEEDETFTVGLTVSGTSADVDASATATGTIWDDDGPALTIEDAGARERIPIVFTVTLDKEVAGGFTVTPVFTDGTATGGGTDYTGVARPLTFAGTAGETKGFRVATTHDGDVEEDETFTVGLTVSGTSVDVNAASTATGTIWDDDTPYLRLDPASVVEGDEGTATMTFTARLTDADGAPKAGADTITAEYRVATEEGNTAGPGRDYVPTRGWVTFAPGETSKTVDVDVFGDAEYEDDETLTMRWMRWENVLLRNREVSAAIGTIHDDDGPTVTLTTAPASVGEGDGATEMTVTATAAAAVAEATDVAVTVGLGGGATSGTDYAAVSDFTITIGAGETSATGTFTLTPTEDTEVEGDETVSVSGSAAGRDVVGTDVTLEDNDTHPFLGLSSPRVVEGDAGTATLTFTARLTDADGQTQAGTDTITASYEVRSEDGDKATAGTDYEATRGTLTFAPGETSKTVDVTVYGDVETEGDETLTMRWVTPWTNVWIARRTAKGTIVGDDLPDVKLAADPGAVGEGDGATEVTVTATVSAAVAEATDVTVTVGSSGAASSGADYAAVADFTITIGAGETSATGTFTLTPTEDTEVEGDETVSVSGRAAGRDVTGTAVTLTDNDSQDDGVPAVTIADASADEGKSIAFTVTLDKAVPGGFKVTPSFTDGTATKGTDYTEYTGALDFAGTAGETVSFTVPTTDDSEGELDETFTVGLAVSGTSHSVTATSTATGTIKDNEGASAESYYGARLSAAPDSVSENGGSQKVTVTAEVSQWGVSSNDRSYVVTVGKGGDGAVSGTDYKAVSKFHVVIPGGQRSGTSSFNLEPLGDTDWEGDETITIHATGPDGAQSTSLRLTDEGDRPYGGPQVTLSANPSKVSEADGATTVTVTAASAAHSASRKVTVSVGGGTAGAGTDYRQVSSFDITLAANATSATGTFTLTPIQDKLSEGDETIVVAGQVDGASSALTPDTLTMTDDEAAADIALSASPSNVTENGGAKTVTVTATAATAATSARTVLVAVGNRRKDTATPGTDYAVVPAFNMTIPANATTATATFSLTPTNDALVEDTESILIDGTPESGSANFTVGGAAMTLTDDDALPAVTLTAAPASVAEGARPTTVTVTATAASAVAWARRVTVSVGKTGSAASGTDYAAVSNFDITILANATKGKGTFTLAPTQDITNEGNETIGVGGTSPRTTVTGTTVTLDDDDINPPVTLSVSPASVSEGASATTVTVTATAATAISTARTVTVSVGGSGTATSGTDYAAVSDFTITIKADSTTGTGTFTLTPTQNTAVEADKTIGVTGTSTGTTMTGTTVTITDDDAYPAVTLSVNPSSVSEGASPTSVTVTATAASSISSARTVTVSVGQTGTAASGADHAAVTDFEVTIAANATTGTGTFTLTPTQDTQVEYNETVGVDGSSPHTTVTGATITLTDDDKDVVTLSLNREKLGEEASATSVTVTATAATAIAAARTVAVTVGGTGTATSGTDYAAVSNFDITIAANATTGTGTFTLTPTQDTNNEGNETIGVAGTNSLATVAGTTLTLVDDDQPTISLSSTKAAFAESWSGTIDVTATRSGSTTSAVDVTIIVGRDTDSATEGVDYTEVADYTITIPAGQTSASKSFSVSGKRDFVADNNETFSIGGLATGYKVSDVPNGVGIFEWFSTIGLTTDVSSVNEQDSATTVTVTAHIHPTVYGNVYVTVSVGGGSATSGTDYAAVSNFTITIPNKASKATGTFTLTPTQDALLESDETININGSGQHWNFYAGQATSMTLTDAQPIALSATPSRISEGAPATQVAVTARATGTVSTPRTVTVSVGGSGTATSGTDYAAVSNFDIVIPANKTGATNTFTLTPTKDSAGEGDETIGVSGSSTGAYVHGTTVTLADENPAVTLTAAPSSVSEGAPATTVTVTATAATAVSSVRTVTVSVGKSGTATSGTDYAAVSDFTITIAANATSGTGSFTLTPTQDSALEGDETIGVTGTSAEAAAISHTTLTLTDDDLPTIALATVPSYVAVAEDGARKSVTVRATAAAAMKDTTTVTLTVGASGDGATKTTDYTTSNVQTITIPKGQATGEASFELTPVQDTLVEGNEAISVSGSSSGGHPVTSTSLTLTDDDKYTITLSANPSSVAESASATSVTVTAAAKSAVSSARTVTVKVGGSGTATSGTDYAAVSDFTITIAANATSGTGTFTLTPTQDTGVEGNETIGVAGTSALSTVTGTTVTLTDDDSYPAITLSANPSSVSEGASATSVTVTATPGSAEPTARTVTVSVGGSGTATTGVDYATVADFTITIPAYDSTGFTGTFTLTPKQDTDVEGSETIGVSGTSASTTVTGTTVTLTDDDTHSIGLSVSPTTVAENAAKQKVTVTATINVARTSATAVTVSVGDASDQATSGTDYKTVSDFTVTIAANATSGTGTFDFEPITDNAYEGFESITVSGTTSQSGGANANSSVNIPVTAATLRLRDASNYPAITLSASPTSVSEGASATSVTVTATAASAIASSREVTVSVGGSGTAVSGTDYAAVSDFRIKMAANATSATGTFTLTPTDDNVFEGDETIGVSATSLSTTVTGTSVTLTDDDAAEVTVNDSSAAEGSAITFTVTLDNAVQGGLTVTPDFTDVTAVEGTDYDENTTALSFTGTAGETQTFTVSTTQDAVVEANETFTVGLTVSNAPSGVTSTDTGTGTIGDDISGGVDRAILTIDDASADEGDSITFTVTLDNAVQGGLTVTPSYTNGTAATGDYTANTDGITFTGTANEQHTFKVATIEDATLEANETIIVGLTVSGTTLGDRITSTDTGTGTINNDDGATITINDASASEGDSIEFTVTLGAAVQGGLTVTPGYTDVTAVKGTDYDENTDALTFTGTKGETKTFKVATTEDAVLEASETFTIGLTVSGTTLTITSTDTGTGTVNNDDAATVTVNDANASEGDSIAFTVTLSEAVQDGLTVTPGYTDGTAVEGTDYDENTGALTFTGTKGETKSFKVGTTEDAVFEAGETFTVGLTVTNAPSGVTATDTGTGTIANDESAAVTIANASATEGDSIAFTVTLDNAVEGGLTVTPDYTDGTAVEGTDYDESTDALTFTGTKGETKTFKVGTTEDLVVEGNETFTIGLTVSDAPPGVTSTDTGTGTIDNDEETPAVNLTVDPATRGEGAGDATVTVKAQLSNVNTFPEDRTVTVSVGGGTAVSGTDYAAVSDFDITIPEGKSSATGTFTLSPTDDNLVESSETADVTGASTGLTVTKASVTLTDNDETPAVNLSVNPASVNEGDATKTLTVTALFSNGNAFPADTTVTVSVGGGTATAGTDYETVSDFDITIPEGDTIATGTFTLTPKEDRVVEGAEGMVVSGSATGLTVRTHPLTLNDNDAVPAVQLAAGDESVAEGATTTEVEVTASFSNGNTLLTDTTVTVSVGGGTAQADVDYAKVADFDITIPQGSTSSKGSFKLTPIDDRLVEGQEDIQLKGTAGDLEVDVGAVKIGDDDPAPEVNLKVAPTYVVEGDPAKTVAVTAVFSNGNAFPRDTLVTLILGGGSATPDADYAPVRDFDVAFAAGDTVGTATFEFLSRQDTLVEGTETIDLVGLPTGLTVNGTALEVWDDDFYDIGLSATPSRVDENAAATAVTVTATATRAIAKARTVTVSVGAARDGATAGTDYAAVADFEVAIAANETSGTGTFTLQPIDDDVVEGNEGITLSGWGDLMIVTDATVTLVEDDRHEIALSADPERVGEGAPATEVTVTATAAAAIAEARTLTVSVGADGDAATEGVDYAAVADFEVTIAANETTGTATFTLAPTDDEAVEGDERITLSGWGDLMAVTDTAVTLVEDDGHEIVLSADPDEVDEGAAATIVTVTATAATAMAEARTVTVAVGADGDAAREGTDYAAVPDFGIRIPANETTGTTTFTLTPTDDDMVEGDETISVLGKGTLMSVAGTVVTLVDDDAHGIVLSADPDEVGEDAPATEVTVTATATTAFAEARTVTVSVGADGDGATKGTDYEAVADFEITIPANDTTATATFTLAPTDDEVVEGDESLSLSGAGTLTSVTGTTVTLTDDDDHAIVLSADPDQVGEAAPATTVTVTATATAATAEARTVTVSVGADGDAAAKGTDYAAVADFDITIPANDTTGTATFILAPTDDDMVEGDEAITLSGAGTLMVVTGTDVTLTDDDGHQIALSADPARVAEAAPATTVTVTATATATTAEARTVTVSVGAAGDAATKGTDYAAVADFEIAIPANDTTGTATFILAPTDDDTAEGDEAITVSGAGTLMVVTGTKVSLTDDDGHVIALSAHPAHVAEAAPATTVTVTATATTTATEPRTVTVSVGAAGDAAAKGTDYAAVTDFDITIPANDTTGTATFTLAPTDDDMVEGDEAITLSGAGALMTVTGTKVSLTDDDDHVIALSADPTHVAEAAPATTVTVTATATATAAEPRTVTVSIGAAGDAATKGTDYAAVPDFDITIPANDTTATATFTLAPTDDDMVEGDEAISLSGAGDLMTVTATAVTLTDDDGHQIALSADPAQVAEAAPATTVTVTATAATTAAEARTVTVSVGKAGDAATKGTDYAAVADFDITIPANDTTGTATFTLAPTDDDVVEGDEAITVSGTGDLMSVTGTAVTLADDEAVPTASLSVEPATVAEAAGATTVTVTATLSNGGTFAADRTVTVSVGGGTATPGADYAEVPDFEVTIPAHGTAGTATFTLAPRQDALAEGDETIAVSGRADGLEVESAALTLTDDEAAEAALSVEPATVAEGAGATTVTVTATLADGATFPRDRTVTVIVGGGTATQGTDYEAVADIAVTIPANETTGTATFTLTTTDDSLVEDDESVSLTGVGERMTVTGTALTLADDDAFPRVRLIVDSVEVAEGADATPIEVRAMFSNGSTFAEDRTLTVSVGGGTATPGTDYTAVPNFEVTIPAHETAGTATFTLAPRQDALVEGDETIWVSGWEDGKDEQRLQVVKSALTLIDDDKLEGRTETLDLSLATIGRTIATQAVDAIGGRLRASAGTSGAAPGTGDGLDMRLPALAALHGRGDASTADGGLGSGGLASGGFGSGGFGSGGFGSGGFGSGGLGSGGLHGLLDGGSLALALGGDAAAGGGWTLWGSGATTGFSGRPGEGVSLDGTTGAAYLGVDRRLGSSGVLGVAVSRSSSGLDFSSADHGDGDVQARLTTVYPYASWSPTRNTEVWGMLGMGGGSVEMSDAGATFGTDGGLRMAAAGLRSGLARLGDVELGLRADAFTVGMEADAVVGTVRATDGRAQRLRLMLDGSTAWALSPSSRLTPSVEVGARVDGGDAETGPGMELGGGLAYAHAGLGLDVEARGRWLAVHRDGDFGEWGGNLSVRRLPAARDQGLSFSFEPAWGEAASGVAALWDGRDPLGAGGGAGNPENAAAWRPDRLDMEVAYGKGLMAGRGSVKPFGELRMAGDSRHLRVGTRLALSGVAGEDGELQVDLLGEQRAQAGGTPVYGAGLNISGTGLRTVGGALAPFGEFTFEGDSGRRLRFGTRLDLTGRRRAPLLHGLSLGMSGEAYSRLGQAAKYSLILRGGWGLGRR